MTGVEVQGIEQLHQAAIFNAKFRVGWTGLHPKSAIPHSPPAKLISVELGGRLPVPLEWIQRMLGQCDLSAVETLKLYMQYGDRAFGTLASSGKFGALSTLVLGAEEYAPDWTVHDEKGTTAAFLTSINPLRNLRFIGEIDEDIFDATLSRHGRSLRRLWFPEPKKALFERFSIQERLERLRKSCLLLEELRIPIARSKGDGREVAIYKTLGGLPMLKTLALTLDCDDESLTLRNGDRFPAPIDPSFDEFEMMEAEDHALRDADTIWDVRNGHVRDALINGALDEMLARNIFARIQIAKADGACPLRHLELRPTRGCYVRDCDPFMHHVGRWWLVTQELPFNGPAEIKATRLRDLADLDIEQGGPLVLGQLDSLVPIVRRVWPQNAESDDDASVVWHSWPLAN